MSTRGRGRLRAQNRANVHRSSSSSLSHTHDLENDVSENDVSTESNDPRIPIEILGVTLRPSHKISSKLKFVFDGLVHPQGMSWKSLPKEHKDLYFKEFKKYFKWDASYDEIIYSLWLKKAARRYSNWVHDIKKLGERPLFISADVWPSWQSYWNSEKVMRISMQARNNRISEPDGPGTDIITHKGGTRCAQEYAIEYAKQKKLPLNKVHWDVFNRFHPPEEASSNSKSAHIGNTVRSKAASMSQSGTSDPDILNDIFLDLASTESKKNRYFGCCIAAGSSEKSTQSCTQLNEDERQKLREELKGELRDELKEELKEEIRQENAQDRENMRAEMQEMRTEMEALRSEFRADYRPL